MNTEYLLAEKISDDTRQEAHEMEMLREESQKQHATLAKHNERIEAQPGLFDYMRDTWQEMLNTNQGARKYF